jgi:hypothetical protein
MFYRKTKWRYNPGDDSEEFFKTPFKLEARSCFLLDQLHYVDSKNSLFTQVADNIIFLIRRYFCDFYIKNIKEANEKIEFNINKVITDENDMKFLVSECCHVGYLDDSAKDLSLVNECPPEFVPNFLISIKKDSY